jgi:DNA polymerase-3 subunit delta
MVPPDALTDNPTMRLTLDNLATHLRQGRLAPAYLLAGDEDLLVGEAADALRAAAREAGYSQREVHFPQRADDWSDLLAAGRSMSLFGDRRLLEVRFNGKAGKDGSAALARIADTAGDDTLLLVITPRLEKATQSAAWVTAIEGRGVFLPIYEIGARQLEAWLEARCRRAGLDATADALALLAARVEGNLLAAQQEIEKLRLLLPAGRVDAAAILEAVAPSARYDVFGLGEAVLAGDAVRAQRILGGLRGEGVEATLVLWSVVRELREMWALRRGDDPSRRAGPRLPPPRLAALERARPRAARLPYARLASRALRADRMIKGRLAGDPWDELVLLCAEACGLRPLR